MSDEDLMLAVCNGDQSAYRAIVKQHLKSISHYAFRLLGNHKDTEDITQEVFLRLWINAARWDPGKARLTTWLHRIAHNLCIDYLRKHGNTEMRDELDQVARENDPELNDRGNPQSQELSIQELSMQELSMQELSTQESAQVLPIRLNNAIRLLPETQRSALMLCHYAGFSNKEAAAIMNVSVKALESSIARARRSLKARLEQTDTTGGEAEAIGQ